MKKKEVTRNIPDWEIQNRKVSTNAPLDPAPIYVDENVSPTRSSGSTASSLSPRSLSVTRGSNASSIGRPVTAPPPPPTGSPAKPPPPPPVLEGNAQRHMMHASLPPPPLPPPIMNGQQNNHPSLPAGQTLLDSVTLKSRTSPSPSSPTPNVANGFCAPPPPPPPPVSGIPAPPPPPGAPVLNSNIIQNVVLSAPKPAEEAPVSDSRNDLLTAIRDGMNLRKAVQITKEERQQVGMGNDVASILSRRIALEFSESEGDSDYSDDGEWSDD